MWHFNNQNSKLYLRLNCPSFSWDSFHVASCFGEWVYEWLLLFLFLLIWSLPTVASVIGAWGSQKRNVNKKVLAGILNVVSWLGLSGPADGWGVTLLWEHFGGSLRSSYLGASYLSWLSMWVIILCGLLGCFLQALEFRIHLWFLFTGVPSPF